ncbi:MAG: rhomboid family intramembrane serine protease [Desulfuromonadales bacterium]|nr:rhomboid family intramembrane serine protease [Desulfuromonadales bacterium]
MRWERRLRETVQTLRHPGRSDLSLVRILIFLCLLLYTAMVLQGVAAGRGMRPLLNPDTALLVHAGAQYWPLVLGEGQWWRCITYAFMHGGLIHLAFNMVVLYQIGPLLENEVGKARFIFLYVLAAVTGTIAGYFWHPMVPVVGASGSLFGLIGFAALYYHRMGDPVAIQRRNFMLQWAAFAFIFGLLVGADNAGHLGGALGGAVLGLVLPIRGPLLRQTDKLFNVLGLLSAIAIVLSLLLLILSWFLLWQ